MAITEVEGLFDLLRQSFGKSARKDEVMTFGQEWARHR